MAGDRTVYSSVSVTILPRRVVRAVELWVDHLSYEQLEAFVDQRLSADGRAKVDRHSAAPAQNTFDQSVLATLAAASPSLGIDFRAKDFPKVASELQSKWEQGDPIGQTGLALLYLAGEGVVRDVAQAESLLRRAADKGSASAPHNLGVLNACGPLGYINEEQARRWYRGEQSRH